MHVQNLPEIDELFQRWRPKWYLAGNLRCPSHDPRHFEDRTNGKSLWDLFHPFGSQIIMNYIIHMLNKREKT